jgi:D-alanyl-D-alanine carboxypeptidase (penicillin-binding protein 5/6)
VDSDIYITIPRGQYANLQAQTDILSVLTAPVAARAELGHLVVMLGDEEQARAPLLALEAVPEGGFWQRLSDSVSMWFDDFGDEGP